MIKKIASIFIVLFLAFQFCGQSVAEADYRAQDVEKETVRNVGKGEDGFLATPEGETVIASRSYAGNTRIVNVIVADGVKSIGDEAFAGCVNLEYIFLPKSVEKLGNDVFKNCPRIYKDKRGVLVCCEYGISKNVLDQLHDQELEVRTHDRDAKPIFTAQLTLYPIVGKPWPVSPFRYTVTKKTDTVREVTVINVDSAERSRKSLEIPDTVTICRKVYKVVGIEKNAFKGMKKLKTVTVGKNVKKIDSNAFRNCKKLTTVKIKSKNCTFSGKGMWKGTSKKLTVKVPKSSLKKMQKRLKKTRLKKSAVKAWK